MNFWHDNRFINSYENNNLLDLYKQRNGNYIDLAKNEFLFFDIKENRFFIFRQLSKNDDYKYEILEVNEQENESESQKQPEKKEFSFREALDYLEKFNNTDIKKVELEKGIDFVNKLKGVRKEAADYVRSTLLKVLKKNGLDSEFAKKLLKSNEFKKEVLISPKIKETINTFKSNLDRLTSNRLGKKLLSSMFDSVASKVFDVSDLMDLFLLLL